MLFRMQLLWVQSGSAMHVSSCIKSQISQTFREVKELVKLINKKNPVQNHTLILCFALTCFTFKVAQGQVIPNSKLVRTKQKSFNKAEGDQPFKSKTFKGFNFYAHKCIMFTESSSGPELRWPPDLFRITKVGALFAWLVAPPHLSFTVTLEMKDGYVRPLSRKGLLLSISLSICRLVQK